MNPSLRPLFQALVGSCLAASGLTAQEAAPPQPPVARIVDRRIERDPATVADIELTREAKLESAKDLRLVVTKSRLRLDVWRGDQIVKTFPVALGWEPAGTKIKQGDGKTPEGTYTLIPQHPSPGFGTSFYICYPGPEDARRGHASGLISADQQKSLLASARAKSLPSKATALGGDILLHSTKDGGPGITETNWTAGCVAMEKAHLRELLALFTKNDRPQLVIKP